MSLQDGKTIRFLHGHIVISGIIFCKSGIFIGGPDDTLQIGGIDKSVVRNPLTGEPYIPGSSLKGKLRSITEKFISPALSARRQGDTQGKVWRHECNDFKQAEKCQLCRIFGSTAFRSTAFRSDNNNNHPGSLLVRDSPLSNKDEMTHDGFPITETKMENAIDRLTSAAHPRTFERVPAEATFEFELIYRVETLAPGGIPDNGKVPRDSTRVQTDITNLLTAMDVLEKDGLGGNISRGYGSIEFQIKELQGYDIKDNTLGGFKLAANEDGKSVKYCKTNVNDIEFLKG